MTRLLLRRFGAAMVLLLLLTFIIFVLQVISPGDPVKSYLGVNAAPADIAVKRHELGLDAGLPVQFWKYLVNLFHGDLGMSFRTHRPVTADLADFLPATVELVAFAFGIAVLLGTLFALSAGLRWPGSGLIRGILLLAATAPPFLLALGGIVLFYAQLGWLPASGQGADTSSPTGILVLVSLFSSDFSLFFAALQHLVLPAVVLAIAPAVAIGRVLRSSLQATLTADHVRTARAKGVPETGVLARHVARNAIGPGLSMGGLQLGFMFAGTVVVEQIFSWPGIGNYLAASIPVSDFPAIAAVTLVLGAFYILVNAIVDILQALADPRLSA
jgi:peptide/nickel transport system permease protein